MPSHTPREHVSGRVRLGSNLRSHRLVSGRTVTDVAGCAGMSVSKLSRIERGQVAVTQDDIRSIGSVLGLSNDVVEALARDASNLAFQLVPGDQMLATRAYYSPFNLSKLVENESLVNTFRSLDQTVVNGLLQTPGYMTALYQNLLAQGAGEDLLADVTEDDFRVTRAMRQTNLLDARKTFTFVLSESALHYRAGDESVMRGQYEQLIATARLPNVTIAILPVDVVGAPIVVGDFVIYDDIMVKNETLTHLISITEPAKIRVYKLTFEAALRSSLCGESAIALIQRLIDDMDVDLRDRSAERDGAFG